MRKTLIIIIFVCFVIFCNGCNKNKDEKNDSKDSVVMKNKVDVDEMGNLSIKSLDDKYKNLVNDYGMSGRGGRFQTHNNNIDSMMKMPTNEKLTFDLGCKIRLGNIYIWNYNDPQNLDLGAKNISIYLSEDNENFTKIDTLNILKATGSDELEYCLEYDFRGILARYLQIVVVDNYCSTEISGLSEIRVYKYKPEIKENSYIQAQPLNQMVNNKSTAYNTDYELGNTSGLSEISFDATHNNNPNDMTIFNDKEIILDLHGSYPISQIALWNYNDPNNLDYGLKKISLSYSLDLFDWKYIDNVDTVKKGDGTDISASLIVNLENKQMRYLKINRLTHYGGEKIGLSEVLFKLGTGYYVEENSDYTSLFSKLSGWSGADGIYTENFSGDDNKKSDTLILFSDTIISSVINAITDVRNDFYMPHNTFGILKNQIPKSKNIKFYYPDNEADAAMIKPDYFKPTTIDPTKNHYYWLGDMLVIENKLYVYCLGINSIDPKIHIVGFEQTHVDLAVLDIVDNEVDFNSTKIYQDVQGKLFGKTIQGGTYHFGAALYNNSLTSNLKSDEYIYNYGYYDFNMQRSLIVSRVRPTEITNFTKYQYLNQSNEWVNNPINLKTLANNIAPEFSISQITSGPDAGKYMLVNTYNTTSNKISVSISNELFNDFSNQQIIYAHDTINQLIGSGNNTYNAKAHPALSNNDELVISYNINGGIDAFKYGNIYRPRFISLKRVKSIQ